MKYLSSFRVFEGATEKAAKRKDKNIEVNPDKLDSMRKKIKDLLNSHDCVIKQEGDDFNVSLDKEKIMQIMFRKDYMAVKKTGNKFPKEFNYDELGKMKKEINDIIKSSPINEELGGLGVLALVGAAIAGPGLYDSAKQLWSKHITSKKYEKTGKTEKVIKTDGNTQIIDEYVGKDGKIYWGYDHLWSPDKFADPEEAKASLDLYTAIFNEEDLPRLKKFIAGIKVKTSLPEYDYLDRPKAVDMIFREDVDHGFMGY
jgi:hypothetical protein